MGKRVVTIGVGMVRNEIDVAEGWALHALGEVDELYVLDDGSTDGTLEALTDLASDGRLTVVQRGADRGYRQGELVTQLAERAYQEHPDQDAVWIVPMDADELWYAQDRLSTVLRDLTFGDGIRDWQPWSGIAASLTDWRPTAIDPSGDDPFRTIQWREPAPAGLPKVALRWRSGLRIDQGAHAAYRGGQTIGDLWYGAGVQVAHFPYRTAEQFTRKALQGAEAYAAAPDLPGTWGAHWRAYGQLAERYGDHVLGDVFREHFWRLSPTDHGMVHQPAPYRRWEQAE